MKVCFPVSKDKGLESEVYGHFGSAPLFVVVDTDNSNVSSINNNDQHHKYGACNPMKALDNQKVDVVVVGGIGAGALSKLNNSGVKVFHSQAATIKENIVLLKARNLPEFALRHCCSGHGFKSACKHY
jgi:predicted Fe-Mo cluster-binding NifX family protein